MSPFFVGTKFKIPPFCRAKFKTHPFLSGQNPKFPPLFGHPFILGQNSEFAPFNGLKFKINPFYWVKIQNSPLFIGSIFCRRSSLRSQTFLSFRMLNLANPKLVGTPCFYLECLLNFDLGDLLKSSL